MSNISVKYINKKQLITLAEEKQIPVEYHPLLIKWVEEDIERELREGDYEEGELGKTSIQFAFEDMEIFLAELRKGHSKEWSELYAKYWEDEPHRFNNAYSVIKKVNPDLALEELKVHCIAMGGDELFTKHFLYLMSQPEGCKNPDRQAEIYSAVYKEQIHAGKSEVFAHQFADNMGTGKYSEHYCYAFADAFEHATNNGKSEDYADVYAWKVGEYVANHCSSFEEVITDDFHRLRIKEIEKDIKHLDK